MTLITLITRMSTWRTAIRSSGACTWYLFIHFTSGIGENYQTGSVGLHLLIDIGLDGKTVSKHFPATLMALMALMTLATLVTLGTYEVGVVWQIIT